MCGREDTRSGQGKVCPRTSRAMLTCASGIAASGTWEFDFGRVKRGDSYSCTTSKRGDAPVRSLAHLEEKEAGSLCPGKHDAVVWNGSLA